MDKELFASFLEIVKAFLVAVKEGRIADLLTSIFG